MYTYVDITLIAQNRTLLQKAPLMGQYTNQTPQQSLAFLLVAYSWKRAKLCDIIGKSHALPFQQYLIHCIRFSNFGRNDDPLNMGGHKSNDHSTVFVNTVLTMIPLL